MSTCPRIWCSMQEILLWSLLPQQPGPPGVAGLRVGPGMCTTPGQLPRRYQEGGGCYGNWGIS